MSRVEVALQKDIESKRQNDVEKTIRECMNTFTTEFLKEKIVESSALGLRKVKLLSEWGYDDALLEKALHMKLIEHDGKTLYDRIKSLLPYSDAVIYTHDGHIIIQWGYGASCSKLAHKYPSIAFTTSVTILCVSLFLICYIISIIIIWYLKLRI